MSKVKLIEEYNTKFGEITKAYKRIHMLENISDLIRNRLTDLSDRTEWALICPLGSLKDGIEQTGKYLKDLQDCGEREQNTICEKLDYYISDCEKNTNVIECIINERPSLKKYIDDFWNKENRISKENLIKDFTSRLDEHFNGFIELLEECIRLNFCMKTKEGKYDFGPNIQLTNKLEYLQSNLNKLNDAITEIKNSEEQDFNKHEDIVCKLKMKNVNCSMGIKRMKKRIEESMSENDYEQRRDY